MLTLINYLIFIAKTFSVGVGRCVISEDTQFIYQSLLAVTDPSNGIMETLTKVLNPEERSRVDDVLARWANALFHSGMLFRVGSLEHLSMRRILLDERIPADVQGLMLDKVLFCIALWDTILKDHDDYCFETCSFKSDPKYPTEPEDWDSDN